MLAGIPVQDRLVLELARRLREIDEIDTAEALERAYDAEQRIVALTVPDREAILWALDDAPDGLTGLRAVLFKEQTWRIQNGLCTREIAAVAGGSVGETPAH